MENIFNKRAASHRVAISCLVGGLFMSLAQMAAAFAPATPSVGTDKEMCAYSLQLQKSVSARRQYLVQVDQALNGSSIAGNTVEDMYGNIKPAAYSPEDDANEQYSLSGMIFGRPASNKFVSMDAFSVDCVGCHDGAGASSIGVNLRNTPFGRKSQVNSFSSDHPIGMDYNSYVAANRGYKPIGANTKMIFVDGKVGCLSCHDPLNAERGHLVMSDRNSALCATCHDK
jgi:predicted CXXCH cytochrome family protein